MARKFDHGASGDVDDVEMCGGDCELVAGHEGACSSGMVDGTHPSCWVMPDEEEDLRWRITTPSGVKIDEDGGGEPLRSRAAAVVFVGAPHLRMKQSTWEKLFTRTATIAGWAKITADGWTIEPIKRDG